jgi:hypothetical protein
VTWPRSSPALAIAGLALATLAIVSIPFFVATTFIGDDHLFLAFARYAPHPLRPFVSDQHGGEYYRPLPMAVWWLLGRIGAGGAPFATLALVLHAAAAVLLATLVRCLGRPLPVAATAAALFLLAPQNLEAAYWFSASTDLWATIFVLGALIAALRGRPLLSALVALGAYLSKESTYVLPVLALVVLPSPAGTPNRFRRRLATPAWLLVPLALVLAVRTGVLGGWGGSGDARAGFAGKLVQIASGLAHVFAGTGLIPEALAFGIGAAVIALCLLSAARRPAGEGRFTPFLLAVVATLPLVAAGWVVGARYFYLPAAGLAWAAGEALAGVGTAARIVLALVLVVLGAAQAAQRRQDVVSYDRRVAAASRAVEAGLSAGHRIFHIDGGIKDLDLAVKEAPRLAPRADEFLVLSDVPASFAIIPPGHQPGATMFVAAPPLPPRGAYQFGRMRLVGLARRGDEPSLDEVLARFPDIRFIRLRPIRGGQVIARDLTDEIKRRLDGVDQEGQNQP